MNINDAIDDLYTILGRHNGEYMDYASYGNAVDDLNIISNFVEGTRWIPVSDRLPKEYIRFQDDPEYVLIFIKNRPGNRVKGFITTGYLSSGIFWGDDNNWKMDEVTHWMPLPEHPSIE